MAALGIKDIRLGVIYRFSLRQRLSREQIVDLLVARADFNIDRAKLLVGHWMTSLPYRDAFLKART